MRVPKSKRSRPYERIRAAARRGSMIGLGTRITRLPTARLLQREAEAAFEWYSQQKAGLAQDVAADLVLVLGVDDGGDARISQANSLDYDLPVA